jgi:hypothetical protein
MTQQADTIMTAPLPAVTVEATGAMAEDPRWLERVGRGVFCLLWLVPVDALGRLLFPVMTLNWWYLGWVFWIRLLAALSAAAFAACGGYFLSLHNPADAEADPPSLVRRALWVGILGWVVGELFYAYVQIARPRVRDLKYSVTVRQAGELLAVVGLCTLMVRLLRVTRRTLGQAQLKKVRGTIVLNMALLIAAESLATVVSGLQWMEYDEREHLLHSLPAVLTPTGLTLMAFVPLPVMAMFLSPSLHDLAHTFRRRGEAARKLGAVPVGAAGFAVLQPQSPVVPQAPAAE